MRIYFDPNSDCLLTEEEAREIALSKMEETEGHLCILMDYSPCEIWDMLSEESKMKIIDETVECYLNDNCHCRDFEEE